MFYEPRNGHGLRHDPLKAIVAPRPIGWISTRSPSGAVNLAPYSFFNMLCSRPPMVMFSSEGAKDSAIFARDSGEFVANLVSRDLAERMNRSSVDAPRETSEFGYAGLTPEPSRLVSAPRVAEARAALECRVTDVTGLRDSTGRTLDTVVVIGEIIGVHIDDNLLTNGLFDIAKAGTIARLGYMDYAALGEIFAMRRPRWGEDGETG